MKDNVQELIESADELCTAAIAHYEKQWSDREDRELVLEVVEMAQDCVTAEQLALDKIKKLGKKATEADRLTLGLAVMAKLGSAMVMSALLAKRFGGAA